MEKMDIFISWSGPRSRGVAEALREYLPMIVNAFNPWLSSADIDKGARWNSDLATALTTAKAGIICLTPNNLTAPYILFESGALSRTVDKAHVCTLLIGMEPSDVTGPLAQFQATKPIREDLLQLVKTLNRTLGDSALKDAQLEATFDLCWPKLKEKLDNLPSDGPTRRPVRLEREMLEELVNYARSTSDANSSMISKTLEKMTVLNSKALLSIREINDRLDKMEKARGLSEAQLAYLTTMSSDWLGAAGALGGQPIEQLHKGPTSVIRERVGLPHDEEKS
jgi:hypothetical protein